MEYKTVCFSGHRPEKFPDKGDENSPITGVIKSILYKEIKDCINDGYNCFITGLARGVDNWAADIIIELKIKGKDLKFVCVRPYEEYGNDWKGFDKWNLSHILEKADDIVTLSKEYTKDCLKKRNIYMVDHSQKLIAIISNYRSGTGQTIRYAQKKGIEVKEININNF